MRTVKSMSVSGSFVAYCGLSLPPSSERVGVTNAGRQRRMEMCILFSADGCAQRFIKIWRDIRLAARFKSKVHLSERPIPGYERNILPTDACRASFVPDTRASVRHPTEVSHISLQSVRARGATPCPCIRTLSYPCSRIYRHHNPGAGEPFKARVLRSP